MEVVWDERKRQINLAEHELDFADIRYEFEFNRAVVRPTYPGKDGRPRFKAIGLLGDRLIAVVFSPLGTEGISLVSMRRAGRSERRLYVKAQENPHS